MLPDQLRTGRVNLGTFKRQQIVATFNKQQLERGQGGPFATKVQTRLPGRPTKEMCLQSREGKNGN